MAMFNLQSTETECTEFDVFILQDEAYLKVSNAIY